MYYGTPGTAEADFLLFPDRFRDSPDSRCIFSSFTHQVVRSCFLLLRNEQNSLRGCCPHSDAEPREGSKYVSLREAPITSETAQTIVRPYVRPRFEKGTSVSDTVISASTTFQKSVHGLF